MTLLFKPEPLSFEGYDIPYHTQQALNDWVCEGYWPGGFLTAVLVNDLQGAVARADYLNIVSLKEICTFVYNRIPAKAWGNADRMRSWANDIWDLKKAQAEVAAE